MNARTKTDRKLTGLAIQRQLWTSWAQMPCNVSSLIYALSGPNPKLTNFCKALLYTSNDGGGADCTSNCVLSKGLRFLPGTLLGSSFS